MQKVKRQSIITNKTHELELPFSEDEMHEFDINYNLPKGCTKEQARFIQFGITEQEHIDYIKYLENE